MFEEIIKELDQHTGDPLWLTDACMKLAGALYQHNESTAHAETKEKKAAIDLIEFSAISDNKKMSVAEADKRSVVITNNEYGIMKGHGDAVVEIINSIKTKLKYLEWEKGSTKGQEG